PRKQQGLILGHLRRAEQFARASRRDIPVTSSIIRLHAIPLLQAILLIAIPASPGGEAPPLHPLERERGLKIELGGPVRRYLDAVTRNWLLPAPEANPATLAILADRDRTPYRDLLPWSGEFAGKYLTGATQVMQSAGDPRLRTHLQGFVAELVKLQDAD